MSFGKLSCQILLPLVISVSVALAQSPNTPEFFETKIRPILVNNCFSCHTNTAMGGLRLDSAEAMLKGGSKRGAAVVAGDPDKSALILAVRHSDPDPKFRMPLGSKLKDADIDALTAWVKAGAVWPKAIPTAAKVNGKFVIFPEQKKFWSMLPLKQPELPSVKDPKWGKTNVDRFVLSRIEKEGLKPVRFASRTDLIRRAYLDLTGLPPTYEEVQAFVKDTSSERLSKGRRQAARLAAVRRTLGPRLARCRALRRRRLSQPQSDAARLQSVSERLCVSRLGDPGLQRRHAVRSVREGADSPAI